MWRGAFFLLAFCAGLLGFGILELQELTATFCFDKKKFGKNLNVLFRYLKFLEHIETFRFDIENYQDSARGWLDKRANNKETGRVKRNSKM